MTNAKITAIIPLKPTYIGNITFIPSQLIMGIGLMQLKYLFAVMLLILTCLSTLYSPEAIIQSDYFHIFFTDSFNKPMYN